MVVVEGEEICSVAHTAVHSKETVVVDVAVVVVVETGSCSEVWTRSSYKFVEHGITLRQFMLYASKFVFSSLSCIFRRGLQSVDSVTSCCCTTCCCCLQCIDALFQFDALGLSICKLLQTAVKIRGETWKPLAFPTCDALCDELFYRNRKLVMQG